MKKVESTVKKFPGYVILSDPLTFPQSIAVEEAIVEAQAQEMTIQAYNYLMLPALMGCVEEWHIEGIPDNVTPDTFPSTPRLSSAQLIGWLLGEVIILWGEGDEVPNA